MMVSLRGVWLLQEYDKSAPFAFFFSFSLEAVYVPHPKGCLVGKLEVSAI